MNTNKREDPTTLQGVMLVFFVLLLLVLSIQKQEYQDKYERQQQLVSDYKAKADSALILADSANALTIKCMQKFAINY